jgi:hypothetical protein
MHVTVSREWLSRRFDELLEMPKPKPDQTNCWLVYFDGIVRWEILEEPENRLKTDRIIRRGKYVGSSVDYRGGGVRLDRHARAAISKEAVKLGSAIMKSFVEKEPRLTSGYWQCLNATLRSSCMFLLPKLYS